jgi:hypothetical protein
MSNHLSRKPMAMGQIPRIPKNFNSGEEDRILPQYPWQAGQPDPPLINDPRGIESLLKWAPRCIL